jgi:hypothetical protein
MVILLHMGGGIIMKKEIYYTTDQEKVLSKALLRAADYWKLSDNDVAKIVGTSASTLSRIRHHKSTIKPESKEGEMVLLLIRAFRSLGAFLGDKMDIQIKWLNAYNKALNAKPIERMQSSEGLVHVVHYLDAIRGNG